MGLAKTKRLTSYLNLYPGKGRDDGVETSRRLLGWEGGLLYKQRRSLTRAGVGTCMGRHSILLTAMHGARFCPTARILVMVYEQLYLRHLFNDAVIGV